MLQIRGSVFETNSSSTHSICISKAKAKIPQNYTLRFRLDEYGWEEDAVYDTASYLYTAIMDGPDNLVELRMDKLKASLDNLGIKSEFDEPKIDCWGCRNYGIDHSYECADLIDALLSDEDLLARYLFGDSVIYTGNDNSDGDPETFDQALEYVLDDDSYEYVKNPYHDETKYDYFWKGN